MPDYAKIAYEVWAQCQEWKDGDCDDIPPWDRLQQDLKDACKPPLMPPLTPNYLEMRPDASTTDPA